MRITSATDLSNRSQASALIADAGTLLDITVADDARTEELVFTVDGDARTLTLDRSRCGTMQSAATAVQATAPLPPVEELDVTIVVDGSVVEVFAADGTVTFCERLMATSPLTQLDVLDVRQRV